MSEHKFKVGDKVKILNKAFLNKIGTIQEYLDSSELKCYRVKFAINIRSYWFKENDLELYKKPKIKNLYSQVLNTKSLDSQIVQLSAEHSELMVELSRLSRNRDDSCYKKIASELVDLEIMVNEFKFYLIEHLKVVNQSEYDSMMEQAINKFDNILNGDK